jgi:outer membrane protein OmpA-like peptidoglycan-associated protein
MKPPIAAVIAVGIGALLLQACATKGFVREQVGTSETRLGQRVDQQQDQLRQSDERTTQALQGLDGRVGQVASVADGAKKDAATAIAAQKEADEAWKQRFANRNRYSPLDQKAVYFDFNKAELKDEGIGELDEIAKALKADPNAVLELQGFADQRGSERYNYQLTRERVDAVTRFLVQKHGIDIRRIYSVGMGKETLPRGEKATRDAMAKSRRVEVRVFAPQS